MKDRGLLLRARVIDTDIMFELGHWLKVCLRGCGNFRTFDYAFVGGII